jgi:nitroreductase
MNEIIQQLCDRKSVRVFTSQPISDEDKALILRAASEAPTAGNQQLYTILDITDQEIKDQLAQSCDHQPFIAQAPMVLVFCADVQKWYDAFHDAGGHPRLPGVGDLMLAVTDTSIAAQNAVTAAWSLGIGSCYIGDIMEQREVHRELLQLPDYVFPAAMLVFGYPTQQQLDRPKPQRCPQGQIVHENCYHRMDGTELRVLLENKPGNQNYETWCQAFCQRKYNSDFSREMTRSVGEYLKQFHG